MFDETDRVCCALIRDRAKYPASDIVAQVLFVSKFFVAKETVQVLTGLFETRFAGSRLSQTQ